MMEKKVLLNKIRSNFPELTWKNYKHIAHGFDHDVIILDNKIVFRFPKTEESKLQMQNEIQALSFLKPKVKIPIPHFIYNSPDKLFGGYKMLKGLELTAGLYQSLSLSEKETIAYQIATFITNLHRTPKRAVVKYHIKTENIQNTHDKFVRDTTHLFPLLNKIEVRCIQEFFIELEATFTHPYKKVLVHNDLTWSNIIWNPVTKKVSIIDFSDRLYSDPACDFTCLWQYGPKFTKRVYELYQGKKDENLLYRSQLYFKRIPLYDMYDSLTGFPTSYEESYNVFKQRFQL